MLGNRNEHDGKILTLMELIMEEGRQGLVFKKLISSMSSDEKQYEKKFKQSRVTRGCSFIYCDQRRPLSSGEP